MSDTIGPLSPEERKRRQEEDRKKKNQDVVRDLQRGRGMRHSSPPPAPPTRGSGGRGRPLDRTKLGRVICLRHPDAGASMILSCAICMRVWNANSIKGKRND